MNTFNVIRYDINRRKFAAYDVLPYLRNTYKELKKTNYRRKNVYKPTPVSFEEFKDFVKDESMYQFWSRCEYEIILSEWPPHPTNPVEEKWDVYGQIMMNLDTVTRLLMEDVVKSK